MAYGTDWPTVHPHACGDNEHIAARQGAQSGSPPRVWGQREKEFVVSSGFGFTPTRVGTTHSGRGSSRAPPVHPHACGDNVRPSCNHDRSRGSPPRVWGQHDLHEMIERGERFTPTRVGTTQGEHQRVGLLMVHPHACGDNVTALESSRFSPGSPPRVWGQRTRLISPLSIFRFTPTRVGTTFFHACQEVFGSVHPHACGDNRRRRSGNEGFVGSPPRVWGQPQASHDVAAIPRFTPTRVGTTGGSIVVTL